MKFKIVKTKFLVSNRSISVNSLLLTLPYRYDPRLATDLSFTINFTFARYGSPSSYYTRYLKIYNDLPKNLFKDTFLIDRAWDIFDKDLNAYSENYNLIY